MFQSCWRWLTGKLGSQNDAANRCEEPIQESMHKDLTNDQIISISQENKTTVETEELFITKKEDTNLVDVENEQMAEHGSLEMQEASDKKVPSDFLPNLEPADSEFEPDEEYSMRQSIEEKLSNNSQEQTFINNNIQIDLTNRVLRIMPQFFTTNFQQSLPIGKKDAPSWHQVQKMDVTPMVLYSKQIDIDNSVWWYLARKEDNVLPPVLQTGQIGPGTGKKIRSRVQIKDIYDDSPFVSGKEWRNVKYDHYKPPTVLHAEETVLKNPYTFELFEIPDLYCIAGRDGLMEQLQLNEANQLDWNRATNNNYVAEALSLFSLGPPNFTEEFDNWMYVQKKYYEPSIDEEFDNTTNEDSVDSDDEDGTSGEENASSDDENVSTGEEDNVSGVEDDFSGVVQENEQPIENAAESKGVWGVFRTWFVGNDQNDVKSEIEDLNNEESVYNDDEYDEYSNDDQDWEDFYDVNEDEPYVIEEEREKDDGRGVFSYFQSWFRRNDKEPDELVEDGERSEQSHESVDDEVDGVFSEDERNSSDKTDRNDKK